MRARLLVVSSSGVSRSGNKCTTLLEPAGCVAESHHIDFRYARFRFLKAAWAPRAPSVPSLDVREFEVRARDLVLKAREIGILMKSDQRQHRILHIQRNVLPHGFC